MNTNLISSPVSMTELGIYLDWMKNLHCTAYNIPYLFPLPEGTDIRRLRDALVRTLRAHPCIMSRFYTDEDGHVIRKAPAPGADNIQLNIKESSGTPDLKELIRPFSSPEEDLYRLHIIHGGARSWLFADFHHILFDGTSTIVFINELTRAYKGQPLAGETMSAADYARQEQIRRTTNEFVRAKEWYSHLLEGGQVYSIPLYDKEEGPEKNTWMKRTLDLDAAEVSAYVRETGIHTSTFFTGVYGYLLSRFCGADKALFSSIYHGRTPQVMEDIGMFVKTFPVLESFDDAEDIRMHLKQLDSQLIKSRGNTLFSFPDICSDFDISIPTMFGYQGSLEEEIDFLDGRVTPESIQSDAPRYQIMTELFRAEGVYRLRISWRANLFEAESMEIFARCYESIAQEYLKKERFGDIDMLCGEYLSLMDSLQPPADAGQAEDDIVSMFQRAAGRYPDRPAVIFKEETLTYRRLDDITDCIAGYLRGQGICRGKVVSVLINRSSYMAAASLGALKSGAAYQPLDPAYPDERLAFMMKDAGCALLIADEDLLEKVPGYTGPVLLTKDIPHLPACGRLPGHPAPGDLFILLYTSGSSGTPKGVMLEHRNLSNFCRWYQKYYQLDEACRVAAYASYGFDACMMDMYPALTAGACVCIAEEEIRLDLTAMEKWYSRLGITHVFMTTQLFRQFYTMASVDTLRYLSGGGERLVPLDSLKERPVPVNCYGPTECTIFSTTMQIDRTYLRIPIGRPLDNYRCYVVDKNLRRLPPLVPGELLIAGAGVGRGYLNRPELTQKVFISNPFCDDPRFARAYRTGDIVRLLPDGNYDFIGRNDDQVKVRGFRVELSEVEAAIRQYPGIRDATVQAFDSPAGGKYIAAYVVSDQPVKTADLNAFIASRKPSYMVPAVTMQIDRIPLNNNQKVSRRQLPQPVLGGGSEKTADTARPLTRFEEEIADIVRKSIGYNVPSPAASLIQYGLTSISTIGLAARLTKRFGVEIPAGFIQNGASIIDIENRIFETWMQRGFQK